ncbi:MAG: aminomethyl-transferring glycine dehydrogenase subunit GcvPA, partial [Candidatus Binatia bacterium]
MRFIPHSALDVERMLATIGVDSIEALFAEIPAGLRARAAVNLPEGLGEQEVATRLADLAGRNRPLTTFQGAGAYHHFVPAVVGQILLRSEFATAYTPYQPEVSQGTLQACFEFQTYVARLTGLDVANASVYDGASALAEAVLMALRIAPKRRRILLSKAVHPQYREVVRTYLEGFGRGEIVEIGVAADGGTDRAALEAALADDVAAICVGYPNVFGVIEDVAGLSAAAAATGALTITATTEALALALLKPPGELGVDIAVGEGQSFGLSMSYGGPGVGLFATRRKHVRQMPGRLVGETTDERGRRGYVLTLSTREQHIRREKATSNICTNQGLAALAATVFLSLAGRRGLRDLAVLNAEIAHAAAAKLESAGLTRAFTGPFFNEFVVAEPAAEGWYRDAVAHGVVPGVRLADLMPDEPLARGRLLVTATECNTPAD